MISKVLSVWKGHLKDLIKFLTALGTCGVVTALCVEHVRDACETYGHCWCPIVRKPISTKGDTEGAGERNVNDTWCWSAREGGTPRPVIKDWLWRGKGKVSGIIEYLPVRPPSIPTGCNSVVASLMCRHPGT